MYVGMSYRHSLESTVLVYILALQYKYLVDMVIAIHDGDKSVVSKFFPPIVQSNGISTPIRRRGECLESRITEEWDFQK
jgi:hypothetical protein